LLQYHCRTYPGIPSTPRAVDGEKGRLGSIFNISASFMNTGTSEALAILMVWVCQPIKATIRSPTAKSPHLLSVTLQCQIILCSLKYNWITCHQLYTVHCIVGNNTIFNPLSQCIREGYGSHSVCLSLCYNHQASCHIYIFGTRCR
jgi:hypothetical protein